MPNCIKCSVLIFVFNAQKDLIYQIIYVYQKNKIAIQNFMIINKEYVFFNAVLDIMKILFNMTVQAVKVNLMKDV